MDADAPLAWTMPHAPRFLHEEALTTDGTWRLGHPDGDGLAHVRFTPAYDGDIGADYRAALAAKDGAEIARLRRHFGPPPFEQGYFASHDDAHAIVPAMLAAAGRGEPRLDEAGFEPAHEFDKHGRRFAVWTRTVPGGHFQITTSHLAEDGRIVDVHLTFEEPRATSWHNLLRLTALHLDADGGVSDVPSDWPEAIADDFESVALAAALAMVERYIATRRVSRAGLAEWNRARGIREDA